MLTVVNRLVVELHVAADVAAITERIRSPEPAPDVRKGDELVPGDARGPGEYVPFVVLVPLATIPHPKVPTQQCTVAMTTYGRTVIEAWQLFNACCDALHARGPRLHSNGLGIYISRISNGGESDKDPDTAQPCIRSVIDLTATTLAVAS